MELTPIFSVGIGKAQEPDLVGIARQLFSDNRETLMPGEHGLCTTLQSYNSTQDCATLNNPEAVKTIKAAIRENAIKFYAGIGFDVDQLNFEVVNLWLNAMVSSAAHPVHCHYGFQVSGCFYVDVPQGSGLVRVFNPIKRIEHSDNPEKTRNQYSAKYFGASIEEGDMLFWESLLHHEVPALEFEGVRHSIAYDIKISKRLEKPKDYKMNLQDYVAVFNINDPALCEQVVAGLNDGKWDKHSFHDVTTDGSTTYADDLDISYQSDAITNKLQGVFERCAKDYLAAVAPQPFLLQALTHIRFNRYNVGTNMKMHHDHIHTIFDGDRKGVPILTILALLNDDFEGGDFLMFDGKKLKLSAGDIIVFPSNFLYPHGVTTVTSGTRYSCVSWAY